MEIEYYIKAESTVGRVDTDQLNLEGELGIDYDKTDLENAIEDWLIEECDIDIEASGLPEDMEYTTAQIKTLR